MDVVDDDDASSSTPPSARVFNVAQWGCLASADPQHEGDHEWAVNEINLSYITPSPLSPRPPKLQHQHHGLFVLCEVVRMDEEQEKRGG